MKIKEILGTGYMDKSFKNEKDFFAKYFTRPFLTRKARKDRPIRVKVNKKGLPEFFGVPIPSTAKPQGIKKVTKKLAGKTRTFYEPIKKQVGMQTIEQLKELTNTTLGGRGTFPNGPDVLALNVYKTSGTEVDANIIIKWGEAQA